MCFMLREMLYAFYSVIWLIIPREAGAGSEIQMRLTTCAMLVLHKLDSLLAWAAQLECHED
jgi:hypothetical protein